MYFSISEKKLSLDSLSMLFLSTFIIFLISYYLKYGVDRALRSSFSIEGNLQQSLYRFSEQIKKEKNLEGIIEALQREVKEVLDSNELDIISISKRSGIICTESIDPLNRHKSLITKVRQNYQHIGNVTQFNNSFFVAFGEREDYLSYYSVNVRRI
ncbi:MAG: hypothetical protein LRY71_17565 [Bacillaceae bacterium]|nr:hypothetical protein [Bacillaceae bacterium]